MPLFLVLREFLFLWPLGISGIKFTGAWAEFTGITKPETELLFLILTLAVYGMAGAWTDSFTRRRH